MPIKIQDLLDSVVKAVESNVDHHLGTPQMGARCQVSDKIIDVLSDACGDVREIEGPYGEAMSTVQTFLELGYRLGVDASTASEYGAPKGEPTRTRKAQVQL